MTVQKPHRFFERHNQAGHVNKLAALLVAVACFIPIAMVAVPGASPASPTFNGGLSAAVAEEAGTDVAANAAPAAPATTAVQPGIGYFPSQYVNQATEIEEPSPTF